MSLAKVLPRRKFLTSCLAIAGSVVIKAQSTRTAAAERRSYSVRAVELVRRNDIVDMLGLLALSDATMNRWIGGDEGIREDELEAFRDSGFRFIHLSVGIGGPSAFDDAMHYMAACNGLIARNTDIFARVDNVGDFDRISRSGKIGIILGLQNADQFRTVDDVQHFYSLGLRCAQLTYNEGNRLGTGATERIDGGLTDYGVEIITAMNENGMLIDLSHCGHETTMDAIEASRKAVAITHSNCRALNNHPRLKRDDVIRKLAAKGGVMGITGIRMFVRDAEPTTLRHMVDHIDHIANLVGIEHVGIGTDSDLWGYDALSAEEKASYERGYKASYRFRDKFDTDDFNHPKRIFDLTEELIRRGYSDEHIGRILGGNFIRLLRSVWKPV